MFGLKTLGLGMRGRDVFCKLIAWIPYLPPTKLNWEEEVTEPGPFHLLGGIEGRAKLELPEKPSVLIPLFAIAA